jgi:hypothetical protein
MSFYFIRDHELVTTSHPPAEAQPLAQFGASLLPPTITDLHQSLAEWGMLGKRPGPIVASRIWAMPTGTLVVRFEAGQEPLPLLSMGMGMDIAAWLVLLDKSMETFVVIARARTVWTPNELANALVYINPLWLPPALVAQPPDNWERVAQATAVAIADGPLTGRPTNRHWQREKEPRSTRK